MDEETAKLPRLKPNKDSSAPLDKESLPLLDKESEAPQNKESLPPLEKDSEAPQNKGSKPALDKDLEAPLNKESSLNKESLLPLEKDSKVPFWQGKKLIIGLLVFLILGSSMLFAISQANASYHNDYALAKSGGQHLQQAEKLLGNLSTSQNIARARQEFRAAFGDFSQVNNEIRLVPDAVGYLPVYGGKIHAAIHLVPLGMALSQAGMTACDLLDLLTSRLHAPLSSHVHGFTQANLSTITQQLQQIMSSLSIVVDQAQQIQPADLQFDPAIARQLDTLRKYGPQLKTALANFMNIVPAMPKLLGIGAPANYLVEILDSTELRPGGGFIGNYGFVNVSMGQLTGAHITDTALFDYQYSLHGKKIPFPSQYRWFPLGEGNWSLRDSNLDADFPTAARAGELLYKKEDGTVPVQGVMAITPAFIQQMLTLTGPIVLPEYHETVTSKNLIDLIHEHQLGSERNGSSDIAAADGLSSQRKHFTAVLAEHFFTRVRQVSGSHSAELLQMLLDSVYSKDIQIYLNDPAAESLLRDIHLDSSIQATSKDDLFVVDANIEGTKANRYIDSTMTDKVTVDAQGTAVHHTTLRYSWTTSGQNYSSSAGYREYLRVYVPQSSVLQTQNGLEQATKGDAFAHKLWAGNFRLNFGETKSITLTWSVPHAATKDADGWHYQEQFQRQAGANWLLQSQVALPPCAQQITTAGGIKQTGKQLAALNLRLEENIQTSVNYTCP